MKRTQILAAVVCILLIATMLPTTAFAADPNYLSFNNTYNPTHNPSAVVVNQPFTIQVVAFDTDFLWVGGVPIALAADGLTGTLSGTTSASSPEFFISSNLKFTTSGSKTITATTTAGYSSDQHTITVSAYGTLYSIGCDSPVTSLAQGASGAFNVVLRDEWGNAITTAGETINATVNGAGGSSITNSATTDANGAATFTLTAGSVGEQVTVTFTSGAISTPYTVNIKETTPTASIDYVNEKLTSLVASAGYSINSSAVTADASGVASINESWFGNTVPIIKTNATAACNSDAQNLPIPARPSAPNVTATHQTTSGGASGINGTTADMEYSTNQTAWTDCAAGSTTLAPGTYYVRAKAVAGISFAGTAASVTINAYQAPSPNPDPGPSDTTPPTILSIKATPYGRTSATLEVVATDASTPLRYQWQVEGSWIDIPGATTATFDYTGLTEGKSYTVRVRVTDAAGNTATSNPVTFTAGASPITGLPDSYSLIVGQSVSWTPSPTGGTWQYDSELLSMTQSGGTVTFTALKTGNTTATYTVNGVSHTVNITINAATIPQTGDMNDPLPFALLALASLAGLGAMLLYKRGPRKIKDFVGRGGAAK